MTPTMKLHVLDRIQYVRTHACTLLHIAGGGSEPLHWTKRPDRCEQQLVQKEGTVEDCSSEWTPSSCPRCPGIQSTPAHW